jgi:hypothetical protein
MCVLCSLKHDTFPERFIIIELVMARKLYFQII